ncbi:MAG: STAS domain-containing protein [Byssovorax sp.]
MAEAITVEVLTQLLSRVPGASTSCRMDTVKGKSSWAYIDSKMAALYAVPDAELQADPGVLMQRIVPEDRARLEALVGQSLQTLAPVLWIGRIELPNGDIRWLESQTMIELESEGVWILYGQTLDVTERKRLELLLERSEEARRRSDALHRTVIDEMPLGVLVMNTQGDVEINNPAQKALFGPLREIVDGDAASAYGFFLPDGQTPYPNEHLPLARAIQGEEVVDDEMLVRNSYTQGDMLLSVSARPLRDESGKITAALTVTQNITRQRALEREVLARNEELAASEEAKTQLIERLRYSIDELSNPILEVWDDVLVMPIIGVVDSRRTADMVQRLLTEVARSQASFVIVDLTGVEIVDTSTADHLMKLIRKVELIGARCVLTGIRPAVAETLVDIGVDFGRITTLRNLKHGLREALRAARRERDGARELGAEDDLADEPAPRRRGRAST